MTATRTSPAEPELSPGLAVSGWQVGAKRAADLALATIALVLAAPLLGLLALAVKLTSSGSAFHRRRVVGQGGGEFEAFKLRTMVQDADTFWATHPELWREFQERFKLHDDPRVTPLGRWLRRTSLDELPQLVNVLRGEMSLVGPRMSTRPELDGYGSWVDLYSWVDLDLSVRPGITGLWQVSGRQELDAAQRAHLDLDIYPQLVALARRADPAADDPGRAERPRGWVSVRGGRATVLRRLSDETGERRKSRAIEPR